MLKYSKITVLYTTLLFLGNILSSTSTMLQPQRTPITQPQQPLNTEKNVKPEGVMNQGSRYNGEYVKVAAHGLGDPVKDYDQPREHENVNYRKFFIRPKSKPQSRFDMIVKGNFYNYILIEYQKKTLNPRAS